MIKVHVKKIFVVAFIFLGFLQYTSEITSESSHSVIVTPSMNSCEESFYTALIDTHIPSLLESSHSTLTDAHITSSPLLEQPPITQSISNKKAIVFDLGEVLIKTNRTKARNILGTGAIASYMMMDFKNPKSLKTVLYEILHSENKQSDTYIIDPYGDIFPTIACDMLKGTRTENACYEQAIKLINDSQHLLCSQREHILCLKSAQIMFDADTLTTVLEPNLEGLALLQECHKEGHEIFILSNFGKDGYAHLRKKYPELFELIKDDHIIISGQVHAVKPEPSIYQHLTKAIQKASITVSPETVFFIDDQKENVAAALEHNITGIHKNKNFKKVRKQLYSLALLKKA